MNIKDLPDAIKAKVLEMGIEHYKEHSLSGDRILEMDLISAFVFSRTSEGFKFWDKIDMGQYEHFYEKYPEIKL